MPITNKWINLLIYIKYAEKSNHCNIICKIKLTWKYFAILLVWCIFKLKRNCYNIFTIILSRKNSYFTLVSSESITLVITIYVSLHPELKHAVQSHKYLIFLWRSGYFFSMAFGIENSEKFKFTFVFFSCVFKGKLEDEKFKTVLLPRQ